MKKTECSEPQPDLPPVEAQKFWTKSLNETGDACQFAYRPRLPFQAKAIHYAGKECSVNIVRRSFEECLSGYDTKAIITPSSTACADLPAVTLAVAISGEGKIEQGRKEFIVKKNGILLLNRAEPYSYITKQKDITLMGVHLSQQTLKNWLPPRFYEESQLIKPTSTWIKPLHDLLFSITPTALDKASVSERELADLICCFLSLCLDDPAGNLSSYKSCLLQRCRKLLDAHFNDPNFSVKSACDMLGISPRTLFAVFQSAGSSFYEELVTRRANYARNMLADPAQRARSIEDIAFLSGFTHRNNLFNAFKKFFGVSPMAYKKQLKLDVAWFLCLYIFDACPMLLA